MVIKKKVYHYVVIQIFQLYNYNLMLKVLIIRISILIELSILILVKNLKRQKVMLTICKLFPIKKIYMRIKF
jgi:hypothetical protein